MADELTGVDSLGVYLTGASYPDVTQADPSAALGNHRSSVEVQPLNALISSPFASIVIEKVFGENGEGAGSLLGIAAGSLAYTAPSGTQGATVAIANGETKLLVDAGSVNKGVRISRDGTEAILRDNAASMGLQLEKGLNNIVGGDNIADAARITGVSNYTAMILRCRGATSITNLQAWVKPLGTGRTSDSAQLGASGSGTVTTTGSVADWPAAPGFLRIEDSGGTLREIVYYSAQAAGACTVPTDGRALLGTSAGAGAADDVITPVPGIRLAPETEAADGSIQTVASITTAPTGRTWDSGITAATGVQVGTLTASANAGLWIHRHFPANSTASPAMLNEIGLAWDFSAVSYLDTLSGLHRVADDALEIVSLFIGEDADPVLTGAADDTEAITAWGSGGIPGVFTIAAPLTYTITPPGAGTKDVRGTVRATNKYGMTSGNVNFSSLVVDTLGADVTKAVNTPTGLALTNLAGGYINARAEYNGAGDATIANKWKFYVSGDGTDPNTQTATTATMARNTIGGATRGLNQDFGPYPNGASISMRISAYESVGATESDLTSSVSVTVNTIRPGIAHNRALFMGNTYLQSQDPETTAVTTYVDVPNNIRFISTPGIVNFWGGAVLIWRMKWDSALPGNNGLWTDFGYTTETISGASATANGVEVSAWGGGSNLLYLAIDSVRKMEIDVTNKTIKSAEIHDQTGDAVISRETDPMANLGWHLMAQAWETLCFDYATVFSLDTDGQYASILNARLHLMASTGDFL